MDFRSYERKALRFKLFTRNTNTLMNNFMETKIYSVNEVDHNVYDTKFLPLTSSDCIRKTVGLKSITTHIYTFFDRILLFILCFDKLHENKYCTTKCMSVYSEFHYYNIYIYYNFDLVYL